MNKLFIQSIIKSTTKMRNIENNNDDNYENHCDD